MWNGLLCAGKVDDQHLLGRATPVVPSVPSPVVPPSVCGPSSPVVLDPELLRFQFESRVDSIRESNRLYMIQNAKKMIEMQEQIDALTRENVRLVKRMVPAKQNW